jgi:hypothetical protein
MTMLRHTTTDFTASTVRTRMAGLVAGAMILTDFGERVIEDLRVGDRIMTRDAGIVMLRAISRRSACAMNAITVRPDSLGMGRPDREITVAPGQHLFLSDWRAEALFGAEAALVPAYRLYDGHYVRETPLEDVSFFELHFEQEQIVYANGLEVGTGCTVDCLIRRAA